MLAFRYPQPPHARWRLRTALRRRVDFVLAQNIEQTQSHPASCVLKLQQVVT